jgi:hypothetical protein
MCYAMKNYKGNRNISWEPVLHKNYKECIREISPGNQYFIRLKVDTDYIPELGIFLLRLSELKGVLIMR